MTKLTESCGGALLLLSLYHPKALTDDAATSSSVNSAYPINLVILTPAYLTLFLSVLVMAYPTTRAMMEDQWIVSPIGRLWRSSGRPPKPLSKHTVLLNDDFCTTGPCTSRGLRITDFPIVEWDAFATIPGPRVLNGSSFAKIRPHF
ncbi:hypothetical protein DL770_007115 [Monosporascus sp. CRB-9-2]|nr:hypothetical protein DL770_007115 [Monosporascus sp. CRB-9-2]